MPAAPDATRVLIVDDSALVRKILTQELTARGIDVVGFARNAADARTKIASLRPDAITLDLEMPGEHGLELLRSLMAEQPLPVVVVSSCTQTGRADAIASLEAGAIGVFGKPAGTFGVRELADELATVLRGARHARVQSDVATRRPTGPRSTSELGAGATERSGSSPERRASRADDAGGAGGAGGSPAPESKPSGRLGRVGRLRGRLTRQTAEESRSTPDAPTPTPTSVGHASGASGGSTSDSNRPAVGLRNPLILIGASTGGTQALATVLQSLPSETPPILIVQHMPAGFTEAFAHRLDSLGALDVREAADKDPIRSGTVLVAPGDRHLEVARSADRLSVRVTDGPKACGHRPSVERLFDSASRAAGGPLMAVILTGMGKDGAAAMARLRQRGAFTVAQDEETSVVFGMPGEAVRLGAADVVAPIQSVADHIMEFSAAPTRRRSA